MEYTYTDYEVTAEECAEEIEIVMEKLKQKEENARDCYRSIMLYDKLKDLIRMFLVCFIREESTWYEILIMRIITWVGLIGINFHVLLLKIGIWFCKKGYKG